MPQNVKKCVQKKKNLLSLVVALYTVVCYYTNYVTINALQDYDSILDVIEEKQNAVMMPSDKSNVGWLD